MAICLIMKNHVLNIRDGKLLWKSPVNNPGFGISLNDGSYIITDNNKLMHMDQFGKIMNSIAVENKIITQPVVNDIGNIITATQNKIYIIE